MSKSVKPESGWQFTFDKPGPQGEEAVTRSKYHQLRESFYKNNR